MEDFKRKQRLTETLRLPQAGQYNRLSVKNHEFENKDWIVKAELTGKYVGNYGNGGDVYAMQPYNMPCLVSGKTFSSDMPVFGYEKDGKTVTSPFKNPAQ